MLLSAGGVTQPRGTGGSSTISGGTCLRRLSAGTQSWGTRGRRRSSLRTRAREFGLRACSTPLPHQGLAPECQGPTSCASASNHPSQVHPESGLSVSVCTTQHRRYEEWQRKVVEQRPSGYGAVSKLAQHALVGKGWCGSAASTASTRQPTPPVLTRRRPCSTTRCPPSLKPPPPPPHTHTSLPYHSSTSHQHQQGGLAPSGLPSHLQNCIGRSRLLHSSRIP